MSSTRFCLSCVFLLVCLFVHKSTQNVLFRSDVSDLNEKNPLNYDKIIRKKRGLLDVSVDVEPVLNFLGNKLPSSIGKTTTSAPFPTSVSSAVQQPSIDNSLTNSPKCGKRIVVHTELITGGRPTKPGDWPWHVAIFRIKTVGSDQQYICGGTLLSHTRVLTAGHCVLENAAVISPERLFASVGKYNIAGGDMGLQEKGVFDIMLHPEFSKVTLANDIAILKLSSRVTYTDYVQPICLWEKENSNKADIFNKVGIVVGWGFTEKNSVASELMRASLPVIDDVTCIKTNPLFYSKFLTDTSFCAGYRNGTSACNGDSGGGMYFSETGEDGGNTWYLRGIVSLSIARKDFQLCDPNEYTIFTDVAKFLDFVRSHL